MNNILLYGICDTINILVEAGNFDALSTDEKSEDGYYMVFFSVIYTMQDKTIINGKIYHLMKEF